jgi:hypothetical protein
MQTVAIEMCCVQMSCCMSNEQVGSQACIAALCLDLMAAKGPKHVSG